MQQISSLIPVETGLFWKNATNALQVSSIGYPFHSLYMQTCPSNACKLDWQENFLVSMYITNFQNQNTYENNFNLIINGSRLFNRNMGIGTYLNQTQAIMQ